MHIPDGYLSPTTCGVLFAAMIPLWSIASHRVKRTVSNKHVPLLAISAAFSFVIMMFNIPIPGGSTGHATGGTLVAILLGPSAACIALTVTLIIQALLFGDGGLTTLGANCFNMAFVLPTTGYLAFRLLSYHAPMGSTRYVLAAGLASYIGINVAALLTGIEFGLQPLLFHTSNGQALYCPYGLKTAITAMSLSHLLFIGWVEALVCALVIRHLASTSPELLHRGTPS